MVDSQRYLQILGVALISVTGCSLPNACRPPLACVSGPNCDLPLEFGSDVARVVDGATVYERTYPGAPRQTTSLRDLPESVESQDTLKLDELSFDANDKARLLLSLHESALNVGGMSVDRACIENGKTIVYAVRGMQERYQIEGSVVGNTLSVRVFGISPDDAAAKTDDVLNGTILELKRRA